MDRSYPYNDPPRLPEGKVDVPAFLAGDGPLELEIGPGRGAFILERCAAATNVRIIGLEIRRKWASIVDARLAKRELHHRARVLCEDARLALVRLTPDGCLDRVFVHFPDPWWKKRHQKRLVVVDPLIVEITRLLKDDGELFVQTDVPDRAVQYRARIAAHEALEDAGAIENNPYGARSNRERRADEDGLPVYRMQFRKKATSSSSSGS